MNTLAAFTSASGRLAPKPFVLAVSAVYVVSFLSQFLLAAPIMAHMSLIPFLFVQLVVAWAWYVLHVQRLRDAGRPSGAVVALTVLYALAIVLLLLVMLAVGAAESSGPGADLFAGAARIFLILYLIGAIAGDSNLGMFGYVLLTVIALIMLPIVIAMIFSAWAATRPSVSAAA